MLRHLLPALLFSFLGCSFANAQSAMFTKVVTAGGNGEEASKAMVGDPSGNLYITGTYDSTCYFGNDSVVYAGPQNMYLAKYNPATGFSWAVAPVLCQQVQGEALAIDDQNNIYVTGYFAGTIDFGSGYHFTSSYISTFIAKYSSSGTLVWVKRVGGENNNPRSIATDAEGNIIIAGQFQGDISYETASFNSFNMAVYILKIGRNGELKWMNRSTGSFMATPRSVSISPDGGVIFTGMFNTTVSFGSISLIGYGGGSDIYVCRMDASGNFQWAVKAGGTGEDWGQSVKCGNDGSIFINGYYEESATFGDFTVNTGAGIYSYNSYVAKIDPGGIFKWVKSFNLGCMNNNLMCLDAKNNIFITSSFRGSAEIGPSVLWSHGYGDVYVVKMDETGQILFAKGAGSDWVEDGSGIALLPSGEIAVTGVVSNNAVFDSITVQSGINTIFIATLRQHGAVAIDEVNYHSADTLDTGDWVEIRNTGTTTLDLSGWMLKDGNDEHIFTIDSSTIIYPASYLVFCQDTGKFNHFHPDLTNVLGPFNFELADNGEKIRLYNKDGLLIAQVRYFAVPPWPTQALGTGRTMELYDYAGELSDGNNWFNGCIGGSPGRRYQACDSVGIVSHKMPDQALLLFPVPVSDNLFVGFYASEDHEFTYQITDIAGKNILTGNFNTVPSGYNRYSIPAGDLPPGVYLVRLSSKTRLLTGKVIKAK